MFYSDHELLLTDGCCSAHAAPWLSSTNRVNKTVILLFATFMLYYHILDKNTLIRQCYSILSLVKIYLVLDYSLYLFLYVFIR